MKFWVVTLLHESDDIFKENIKQIISYLETSYSKYCRDVSNLDLFFSGRWFYKTNQIANYDDALKIIVIKE